MRISPQRRAQALITFAKLRQLHPDAHCELHHADPFQLLVATVLSAQSTDKMVNQVTPALFARYGSAEALAQAPLHEIEKLIQRLGFFRTKARNIVGLAQKIIESYQGQVPTNFQALISLPGVGRKTANVVLGDAFGRPEGVVVDTHVQRLSQRLGWTHATSPEKIEQELTAIFPLEDRALVAHVLIFHGRRVCTARRPACAQCGVRDLCPSADKAESIGRKKK